MPDPLILLAIAGAYFVGSVIKGVTGFGAILIAVPIMSMVTDAPTAIALTLVPVILSNLWQLYESGQFAWVVKRFWPLLATLVPCSFIGSQFLVLVDPKISVAVIGAMVVLFCATRIFAFELQIPDRHQSVAAPTIGALAGLFGGATILTGSVLIMYLVALNLKKDQFVGAIALMYICSSTPIYMTLSWAGKYTFNEVFVSAFLMLPAFAGLSLGRKVRDRVSQVLFQRLVTLLLLSIGILLISRSF